MKPTKKAKKGLARMVAATERMGLYDAELQELNIIPETRDKLTKETWQRLTLHRQVDQAKRKLCDFEAVADAAREFWQQSVEALNKSASVSAKERAEAVVQAADRFWKKARDGVYAWRQAFDAARDELADFNDRMSKVIGNRINRKHAAAKKKVENIGLHTKVLSRKRERRHAVEVDIDDDSRVSISGEPTAADLALLHRWAENYRAVTAVREHEPKRRGRIVSSLLIPKKSVKKK